MPLRPTQSPPKLLSAEKVEVRGKKGRSLFAALGDLAHAMLDQ